MTAGETLLDAETVRKLFHYDPESGAFTWRPRPGDMFADARSCAAWHSRCAGKQAGFLNSGYLEFSWNNRRYRVHRAIWIWMTGEWPPLFMDHKNRNRADNRWANLRLATRRQNQGNRGKAKHNTTGFKGVRFHPKPGRWSAQLRLSGKTGHLGMFDTPEEAHAAYCEAAKAAFGEFFNPGH